MQVNVSASEGLVIPVGISSPSVSLPQDLITERREDTGLLLCSICRQRKEDCAVRYGLLLYVDVHVPVAVTVLRRLSQYLPNRFTNQTLVTE